MLSRQISKILDVCMELGIWVLGFPSRRSSMTALFDRHALGEIPWFVDVATKFNGNIVGK